MEMPQMDIYGCTAYLHLANYYYLWQEWGLHIPPFIGHVLVICSSDRLSSGRLFMSGRGHKAVVRPG